jgi:tRNA (guanine-N(7)-)-methyltransferase subunit TRM82
MLTPFQRLLLCNREGSELQTVLLAASGPSIRTFNPNNGSFISKWSHLDVSEANSSSHDGSKVSHEEEREGPPEKRRKVDEEEVSDTPSAEIVVENGTRRRRKPRRPAFTTPMITHLCSTSNGRYIVAVTGEDKCIRVLELLEDGRLSQLSQRVMPKRPSAVTLTNDQATILCADKFGDVYAIPLIIPRAEESESPKLTTTSTQSTALKDQKEEEQDLQSFQPSANTLTVHTQRNLRALEEQKRQKGKRKETKTLTFTHKLLLGHVSLLTDIISISISPSDGPSHGKRNYILTADRDEHIRVSRGIPQTHVIETYCLGHEQFINKIHAPAWQLQTLISGGGDDYLLIWDWRRGEARQQISIKEHLLAAQNASSENTQPTGDTLAIAVSGIWSMELENGSGQVIVACEA